MSRRRRTGLVALAVLSLLGGLLVVGAVAVVTWGDRAGGSTRSEIVIDQAVVAKWNEALAPALADLNDLGDVPGLRAEGSARVLPCSIDSGELFDLSAGRSWTAVMPGREVSSADGPSITPGTARGFQGIIRQLREKGWHVTDRLAVLGMELPDGLKFDTVHLERTVDGTTLGVGLQMFEGAVVANAGFHGSRQACRRSRD